MPEPLLQSPLCRRARRRIFRISFPERRHVMPEPISLNTSSITEAICCSQRNTAIRRASAVHSPTRWLRSIQFHGGNDMSCHGSRLRAPTATSYKHHRGLDHDIKKPKLDKHPDSLSSIYEETTGVRRATASKPSQMAGCAA